MASTAVALTSPVGTKVGVLVAAPPGTGVKVGKALQTISDVGVDVGVETAIGLTSGVNVAVNVGRLVAIGVSLTRAISGTGAVKDCQLKSVSISKKITVPITTFKVNK